jgi:hypothetical protein
MTLQEQILDYWKNVAEKVYNSTLEKVPCFYDRRLKTFSVFGYNKYTYPEEVEKISIFAFAEIAALSGCTFEELKDDNDWSI